MIVFSVSHLLSDKRGPVICGRCLEGVIRLDDEFADLQWKRFESHQCVESGSSGKVKLRVEEILLYDHELDSLEAGTVAGIRMSGIGLENLADLDFENSRKAGILWQLLADPNPCDQDSPNSRAL